MAGIKALLDRNQVAVRVGIKTGLIFLGIALFGALVGGLPLLMKNDTGLMISLIWTVLLTVVLGFSPVWAAYVYIKENQTETPSDAFMGGGIAGAVNLFVQDLGQIIVIFVILAGVLAWNLIYGLASGFDGEILKNYAGLMLGTLLFGALWIVGVSIFGFLVGGVSAWLLKTASKK